MIDRNKLADLVAPTNLGNGRLGFTVFNNLEVSLSEKKYQDLLAIIKRTGETPIQAIERLIIEDEEGSKFIEPRANRHNPNKLDYYNLKYGCEY